MPLKEILHGYGLELSLMIAGGVGGVLSLSFEKRLTFGRASMMILTGVFTAGYLAPLAMHYTSIAPEFRYGIAFMIGISAMQLIKFIMLYATKQLAKKIDA